MFVYRCFFGVGDGTKYWIYYFGYHQIILCLSLCVSHSLIHTHTDTLNLSANIYSGISMTEDWLDGGSANRGSLIL